MNNQIFIILFATAIGLSCALIAWLFSHSVSKVPEEDRFYKDPPPLGFRLVWPLIRWVTHFLEPLLSYKIYQTVLAKLRKAGLDYTISPAQYMSARILSAIFTALLFLWGVSSFDHPGRNSNGTSLSTYLQLMTMGALLGWAYPAIWLNDLLKKRRSELLKTFPFYLDIITLCVEAGLNMQGAMTQAVAKGPKGVIRLEFQRVLRDIRAGKGRSESLRALAERLGEPAVTNFTIAVIQAESMGMNLGPVLRAQADQRRSERFLRAEKLAMEAPVKMLFPLIAFIFPCTFVVIFFPIAMKFMHSGF
ncbi:type II secretion system F family protein [Undibacterium sp. SXout20W]|uniref:type II secretion system F family protein n=1 Tax=Undibacterium sp. SXout20W TaxID=3413051 RepID=UPI003BF3D5C3